MSGYRFGFNSIVLLILVYTALIGVFQSLLPLAIVIPAIFGLKVYDWNQGGFED